MAECPECAHLLGRIKDICEHKVLTPEKCDAYRIKIGITPKFGAPVGQKLTLMQKAGSLVKAVGNATTRYIKTGQATADQTVIDSRLAICQTCPEFTGTGCKLCGCSCSGKKNLANKLANADESCPATIQRWKAVPTINPKRTAPKPTDPVITTPANFSGPLVRHMIYHIWPTKRSDMWKWNVAELLKRIKLFDGLRIIGIATGDDTATVDEVKAAFAGVRIDHWVIAPNDEKLGEGATFFKMMSLLPSGANDVTWYGHAKGTKYEPAKIGVVARWTEMLYRTTLSHWSEVEAALTSFPIAGPMKRYGDFNKPDTWRWHYSGTFFWFRNADVLAKDWKRGVSFYGIIECWPSCHFQASEAACLFGNDVGLLYQESHIAKLEAEIKTWPAEERTASNGVSDRWFFEEEYRRQIESGNWPSLVATHTAGAQALADIGAKTVIEIGSGLGPFLVGAKAIGLRAAGMGVSSLERDFAITQGVPPEMYHLSTADEYQLPKADAVYCIEVFEHITDEELEPLLSQIGQRCRWFYFSSTPHVAEDDAQWGHINVKPKAGWIEMFAKYGLRFARDDCSVVPWGMLFTSQSSTQ